jgi:two-component system response regulator
LPCRAKEKKVLHNPDAIEIILIEDNPHDAELVLRALKKHGLTNKLQLLQDGAEALDFIFATGAYAERDLNHRPKLILLDLKLPKVDGLEILRRLKGDERTRSIPVVVMTSSQEEKDIVESYSLGVNSYIVKPVDFDKFVQSVADLGLYWLLLNKVPG